MFVGANNFSILVKINFEFMYHSFIFYVVYKIWNKGQHHLGTLFSEVKQWESILELPTIRN